MGCVYIKKAEEKYIYSYWKSFDEVARERKYLALLEGFSIEETIDCVENSIKNNYPHYFVVNNSEDVVGWCDIVPLKYNESIGYLGIGIVKKYRGLGIGKQLIKTALKGAYEYGFLRVDLELLGKNTRAYNLYKSIGFVNTGFIENGVDMQYIKDDIIQMSIDIRDGI